MFDKISSVQVEYLFLDIQSMKKRLRVVHIYGRTRETRTQDVRSRERTFNL